MESFIGAVNHISRGVAEILLKQDHQVLSVGLSLEPSHNGVWPEGPCMFGLVTCIWKRTKGTKRDQEAAKSRQSQCAAFSLLQKAHHCFLLSSSSCVLCMFLFSPFLGMSLFLCQGAYLQDTLVKALVRSFLIVPLSPLLPSCFLSLSSFPLFLSCLFLFETEFHTVAQLGLELMIIILSQTPVCWDYVCESPLLMLS